MPCRTTPYEQRGGGAIADETKTGNVANHLLFSTWYKAGSIVSLGEASCGASLVKACIPVAIKVLRCTPDIFIASAATTSSLVVQATTTVCFAKATMLGNSALP
jgi:hypothetical protein